MKSIVLLLLMAKFYRTKAETSSETTYKAAVLEHVRVPYADTALETMLLNARIYVENAERAARQGADILLFPEYGVFGSGDVPSRHAEHEDEYFEGFFIYLPNEAAGWNPCDEPKKYHGPDDYADTYKVLHFLSCGALNNSIVLVVNILTKEPCVNLTSNCSSDSLHKYNTNLVIGKNGTILGHYHKRYLYGEPDLSPAPQPEFVIIDAGFVKFGTFICFDLMYADPAFEYVTKYGIRNLMFTTAWINELPFLTSPQFFERYARGMGVNLVVSNAYMPQATRLGSGIYSSSKGAVAETYDLATPGRLLVAELPVNPLPVQQQDSRCDLTVPENRTFTETSDATGYQKFILTQQPTSAPTNQTHKIYYQSLQNFSRQMLEEEAGLLVQCDGDLCCQLEYKFASRDGTKYAFAVANNYHYFGKYHFYMQVCSVLRCETEDIETCGRVPAKPTAAQFTTLSLSGNFATSVLLPSMIGTDLQSIDDSKWTFAKGSCPDTMENFKSAGTISLTDVPETPIMVASIYGRVFERD